MTKLKSTTIFALLAVCMVGCGPEVKKPLRLCPGKATAEEAIAALGGQVKYLVPFKASGDCIYVYDANGRKREEQLRVMVRIEPPAKVYLQGGSVIGKAVLLGANDSEFWLALMPKEISAYMWGVWSDDGVRDCLDKLWLGPKLWLEAFGVVKAASIADVSGIWELSHEGPFDILSRKNAAGKVTKRVSIFCCDYRIRKIEYFDEQCRELAVTELDDYVPVVKGGGWYVPRMVKITGGKREMVRVELSEVEKTQFTDKQRHVLFERPTSEGFEHVGRMNAACEFVDESHTP
ncbi:MAG: hypothetical protein Q7T18_07270 [Sedimentisphaerales bacterium]|nr:hypothetical protein [Sedimentisphaerales bacterium]